MVFANQFPSHEPLDVVINVHWVLMTLHLLQTSWGIAEPSLAVIIDLSYSFDRERNMVKIWNNGKGIPVVEHKTEKMYVPSLIFGHLLTSSNYDDTEKKVTGNFWCCHSLIFLHLFILYHHHDY